MSFENYCKFMNLLVQTAIPLGKASVISNEFIQDKILRCPCSTKYHGCYRGGLLEHTLNVVKAIKKLNIINPVEKDRLDWKQLVFVALVHDLGKMGTLEGDFYLENPDEQKRKQEPFIINYELISIPHEIRALYWLDKLNIRNLSDDEYQAICFHNGPYRAGYMDTIKKESPLLILLHSADNITTKIIER